MPTILVFGASNTYGVWDREGGWVQRLRKLVDEKNLEKDSASPGVWLKNFYLIYNLGVSGDTTDSLLKRFEFELKQRMDQEDEDWGCALIFHVGLNDSLFNNESRQLNVPPNKFQENVEKLINLAKKHSSQIIFVGTLPVDETRIDPVPWIPDSSYRNELVEEYNEVTKSACKIAGVHFVDIYQQFINSDYQSLLEDGVHGNSEGHKVIFEIVRDYLAENKILDI